MDNLAALASLAEAIPEVAPLDEYNRALVSQVHPPDWVNPEPAGCYNLVVLGAGTAGLVSAAGAVGLGARVALVEKKLLGGDCLNVGCVPSKALLRAARAAADVRDAGRFGVRVPEGVTVDFPEVMERMRRLRAGISPHDSARRFQGLGVDVFLGEGRFTGPDTLEVAGKTLRFTRAVIATGARAAKLPIPGLAEAGYLTNETVFSLTQLPRRLAVIGAGPIGCELSQAFARFGSRVTLIKAERGILPRDDRAAAALIERSLLRDGIEIKGGGKSLTVSTDGEGKRLTVATGEETYSLSVDEILVGGGRAANVENIGLEAAGVEYDRKGVKVNDRLRTSNKRIYAAGDVCSRYQFTHAADALARIVLRNALFPFGRARASALVMPWCTYTDPEVAHVGLSEPEAEAKGIPVTTLVQELAEVDRAILDGETEGFVKVHVRRGTDRLVGATVVARHAGEMISELTLAMVRKAGLRGLAETIHPYPTQAEAFKKIADAYNRTRLTPLVKWLIGKWLARGRE
jgi:pyruvate/2-oxoglutarate dehydrogenase complex dihydrolipoamide dehydrogenase (E3) component